MRTRTSVVAVLLAGAALLGSAGTAAAAAGPVSGHERAPSGGKSLTLPLDLLGLPPITITAGR
ncbi:MULTISPECIES: hypothetical protein [unclassified Streptomyces]|uniref:hypothetical protein n=1 Tax=unclassified Streptomyces TaxID=2593676 RepID=UPI002DD9E34C|nr:MULTISPECIES: hypothetical protein [unclassified Streptomyces]WSA92817.1 hypothetical protein OIE63_15525 [Streptomyces sp. NBC_01795]WSB77187.1 hypothetical protein OHB04_16360 [Streptomyces sp. NBC_01775]WSS14549.1 hypothetical protein OG533_23615 [Streptomyces sp. NBC_01186]WSS43367.1 hypothetical protein OG220_24300 [Streptomyces sp. NBC_01187]